MNGNGGVALCSSGRISCENEIVVLDVADMTRKASLVLCGIDRFAVDEPPEAPAMAVRIFPGVLDHHLHGGCRARHRDWWKFRGLLPLVGKLHQYRAIRKGQGSALVSVHGDVVCQNGTKLIERRRFLCGSDETPVAISLGKRNALEG